MIAWLSSLQTRGWFLAVGYVVGIAMGSTLVGFPPPIYAWVAVAFVVAACCLADFRRFTNAAKE